MNRLCIALLGAALWTSSAHAQVNSNVATRCSAAVVYDTTVLGTTKLVSAPTIGGIYVCGFTFGSSASATINVGLTYSTPGIVVTSTVGPGPVVTAAVQNKITPSWSVLSSTVPAINDSSSAYRGLFVPAGNQLNLTTATATGSIQAIIYYWVQNP